MLTWKLWRALLTPPLNYRLFHVICQYRTLRLESLISVLSPVGIAALLIALAAGIWYSPRLIMPLLFHPVCVAFIVLVLFTGTVYGLVWSTSISQIISRLRGEGKYDLLVLAPATPLYINWAICTGLLYRDQAFKRISQQRARITQFLMMITSIMAIPLLLGILTQNTEYFEDVFSVMIHLVALTAAFHVDHIQSAVIGSLVGINTPLLAHGEADVRLFAGGTFLLLQLASYLIAWVLGFLILPALIGPSTELGEISLPIFRVLVFYLSREGIILILWHVLAQRLHAHPAEMDLRASY